MSLNPETILSNKPLPDTTILVVPADVSMVVLARALAQFGLHMTATLDGRARVEHAELTREEALRLNGRNARDTMHFTPSNGLCYMCGGDLVEQYGKASIAAGLNVTGCRSCNRSFCD